MAPRVGEPVVLGRVQRRQQERVLGRDALGDRHAAHLVDVALAHAGSRARGRRCRTRSARARTRARAAAGRMQVAGVRGLADQHPGALAALLERLLVGRRLVIRADAGGQVGVQTGCRARPGAWPSTCVAPRSVELAQLGRIARDDGREVHHLGDAERVPAPQHGLEVADRERPARRLERGSPGTHDDAITQTSSGTSSQHVEQPVDAVGAEHVGDLVRVGDDRGRARARARRARTRRPSASTTRCARARR